MARENQNFPPCPWLVVLRPVGTFIQPCQGQPTQRILLWRNMCSRTWWVGRTPATAGPTPHLPARTRPPWVDGAPIMNRPPARLAPTRGQPPRPNNGPGPTLPNPGRQMRPAGGGPSRMKARRQCLCPPLTLPPARRAPPRGKWPRPNNGTGPTLPRPGPQLRPAGGGPSLMKVAMSQYVRCEAAVPLHY